MSQVLQEVVLRGNTVDTQALPAEGMHCQQRLDGEPWRSRVCTAAKLLVESCTLIRPAFCWTHIRAIAVNKHLDCFQILTGPQCTSSQRIKADLYKTYLSINKYRYPRKAVGQNLLTGAWSHLQMFYSVPIPKRKSPFIVTDSQLIKLRFCFVLSFSPPN